MRLIFSMEKETRIFNWEQDVYTPHSSISSRTEEFVSYRMAYVVL